MLRPFLPALALLATVPAVAQDVPALDGTQWAQLSIHQRIIIRIPRIPGVTRAARPDRPPPPPPIAWEERHASRCVPMAAIAGAKLSRPDAIDLLLDDGERLRAILADHCPALDFYNGFYLRGTADGKACARRDAIQMRSGATCPIRAFRRLVPRR